MSRNEQVPSASGYRADIDGLRGLAVIAVIVNHFNKAILPSGYLGVDIFFVISGFVITASLAARRPIHSGRDLLLGFYSRRVKRILPALLLCVLITAPLICLFDPDPQSSLATGMAALFGMSNIQLYQQATDYFARSSELNAMTHTWSLGVEEQFYLVFPLLVWYSGFSSGRAPGRRRLFALIAAASGLSLAGFLLWVGANPPAAYFLLPARFWELGAGCLLFLLLGAGGWRRIREGRTALLALLLLVAALFLPQDWQALATIAVVVLTLLLIATAPGSGAVRRWLGHPWAVQLGLLSYSLYLWHWSVLSLSRWTIGIQGWTIPLQILSMILLAWASFHYVETPLRRAQWSRLRWRTIGFGLLAALGSLVPLWALAHPLEGNLYLGRRRAADGRRDGGRLGIDGTKVIPPNCASDARDDQVLADQAGFDRYADLCTAIPKDPPARSTKHLYVVGDSHAMAFSPVVERLFQGGGYTISIITRPGCPFPDTEFGSTEPGCSRFLHLSQAHILSKARPGDRVVVVGYHLSYLGNTSTRRDTREPFRGPDGRPLTSASAKQAAYREAVSAFARKASSRGVATILVGATPRNIDYETCFQEWFNLQGAEHCESEVRRQVSYARAMNRKLEAGLADDVRFLDPMPILCGKRCDNGRVSTLLRDRDHLSAQGVLLLFERFRELLGSQASIPAPSALRPPPGGVNGLDRLRVSRFPGRLPAA